MFGYYQNDGKYMLYMKLNMSDSVNPVDYFMLSFVEKQDKDFSNIKDHRVVICSDRYSSA